MKGYFLFGFTVLMILAAAVFGVVKRGSYTDITKEENYLEKLHVAELSEQFAIKGCDKLQQELPDCPVILRVEAIGGIEHLFGADRQMVRILEIFKGDGLEKQQEIYLYSDHWRLVLFDDTKSIERGFVNIMNEGSEYLIFSTGKIDDLEDAVPIYKIYDENYITPVFCYEDRTNVIVPTGEESTYVSYAEVKNNEFFSVSEKGIRAWEQLKEQMLITYSGNQY